MTRKLHHPGPDESMPKVRAHAAKLALWSLIMLTPAWIASSPVHAQNYQVIHNFDSTSAEGAHPNGLALGAGNNVFGTTQYGDSVQGTVFKIDSTHVFT